MGEIQSWPFQLSFNASLKVGFHGSRVTSDGGLILVRELDEGPLEVGGKHYQFRETFVCTADFMSGTSKREVSTDGKTWIPFWEAKFVKAKPGATKN